MNDNSLAEPGAASAKPPHCFKLFALGGAGIHIMEQLGDLPSTKCVAVNSEPISLQASCPAEILHLETALLRGLGTGGDPERGQALAEEHVAKFRTLCEGATAVFLMAGLGGGAGTGFSPVLARVAKEAGALVLAFVTTPFDCEGNRRRHIAQAGLEELKNVADGVIYLQNQKLLKLIDETTSVLQTFRLANELVADAVRGVWRLLARPGLLELPFEQVCNLLRDKHAESVFAVAEALGPTRSRDVLDKLLAHPMLEGGKILGEAEAVLVSLVGGDDLTMAEVNRVMEQINTQCKNAQVLMGAAIDENLRERLSLTLIASRKTEGMDIPQRTISGSESLDSQLLERGTAGRPGSRFVPPPPPSLPQEQLEKLMARQGRGTGRVRKNPAKLRQGQLPLEIVSKGRFDKSEPTIHKGEDLDVPTYIRRGISLN
jgi:cell division protein FtsZ